MQVKRWTPEEDETLRQLYHTQHPVLGKLDAYKIHWHFMRGRTANAILTRACALGLLCRERKR